VRLSEENCKQPKAGDPPLSPEETKNLITDIPRWTLTDKSIQREFSFKNFCQSMDFVNQVADLAEKQNHHPDIFISYNRVKLILSTHKVGGLSRNDFILAAKIDLLA
jgi:4a-hydroxytetrahydrobiopterin dehydratase